MNFYKLGIRSDLVYALECQNILTPTPIQQMAIPKINKGKDLLAEAQTGTGKTMAFLLPAFQAVDPTMESIQILIITPTRELALQITSVAKTLSEVVPVGILAAYGGQDVNAQLSKLKENVHMVIGTPGRILDHIRRGSINFDTLSMFIVDEADQMFHIGFKKDVDAIVASLPKKRQTLCFSATLSHTVDGFSSKHLNDPVVVIAPKKQITLEAITQSVIHTSNRKKFEDLKTILAQEKPNKAMIFCRSRLGTHSLYEEMLAAGYNVEALHGDLTQAKREFVMASFKDGDLKYLVATDVASRGLDVEGITHVINYNLPDDPENYVHRIGRTGRAGESGVAITLLTEKDSKRLESIESFIGMKLSTEIIRPNQ